ncbi:hypothetical protein TK78_14415 [Streptomyces sp. Tue 6075]|nr:hypothetical protein TK78_14415 [Streptomyces sp. Tue 6075]
MTGRAVAADIALVALRRGRPRAADPGRRGARGPGPVDPAPRGEPGLTRTAGPTRRAGPRPLSAGPRSSRPPPCRGSGPAPAAA